MWGVVISCVSIFTMWLLVIAKKWVGRRLSSEAILADANCTLVCIYMSLVLLASSAFYEVLGWGFIDSIGALGLAIFSWKEGKRVLPRLEGKVVNVLMSKRLPFFHFLLIIFWI